MQRVAHITFSLTLMVLVLLSSTGLHLSQHTCGGKVVNSSFFGNAAPCGHITTAAKACPIHGLMVSDTPNDCCGDQERSIDKLDVNLLSPTVDIATPTLLISDVFYATTFVSFLLEEALEIFKLEDPPPKSTLPVQLALIQSYRL